MLFFNCRQFLPNILFRLPFKDAPFDPMSPFFQDEFIFSKEGETKKRRNDKNNGGYGNPHSHDDDDEKDDQDDW